MENEQIKTSIWLVDWDYEASIEDVTYILDDIDNIILFGTYFSENGEFVQTDQFNDMTEHIFNDHSFMNKNIYVSFINDAFLSDGTVKQKSPDLLIKLLSDEAGRTKHIEQIVEYVSESDFQGVEIDYEKIPDDLIEDYFLFIEQLYDVLTEQNLKLRVILEPGFPIERYNLPQEPNYVVMAYNLHGYHSEAGPKANMEFLDDIASKFPNETYNIEIALATGGFSWQGETVTALTEQEIVDLIEKYDLDVMRDEQSYANTFTHNEENGSVEVWYADGETLTYWGKRLIERGNYDRLSFWRAGGLSNKTLREIGNIQLAN